MTLLSPKLPAVVPAVLSRTPRRLLCTLGALGALALLSACQAPQDTAFSGYAEVDLVYLAPANAGVLQQLNVERGEHVLAGAPLFQVDDRAESYSRQAAEAQQQRAAAQLADLNKGRRKEEIRAPKPSSPRRAPPWTSPRPSSNASANWCTRVSPLRPSSMTWTPHNAAMPPA